MLELTWPAHTHALTPPETAALATGRAAICVWNYAPAGIMSGAF